MSAAVGEAMQSVGGTSQRGEWRFTRWSPPALSQHIDHLWAYSGPTQHGRKRVFPNGCIELLVNLAEPYALDTPGGPEPLPAAWVSGPLTRALVVRQPARQACVAVRLRPAGAYALLAQPLAGVADLSVDLRDLGLGASELVERCAEATTHEAQLRVLARWLAQRLCSGPLLDPAIAWAARAIEGAQGTTAIAALRERTGLSKPRLSALFDAQIGVGPKLYARIVRFRGALARLQASAAPRLSEVALSLAFYDQPHMNAEFRALGGMTPSEFLAARHPVGDGSTAADSE